MIGKVYKKCLVLRLKMVKDRPAIILPDSSYRWKVVQVDFQGKSYLRFPYFEKGESGKFDFLSHAGYLPIF